MKRSIVIIGAGIGGLAAGCYARMNGYDTTILEMHNLPGGVCTSWRRKGYVFDGCIHHLAGCSPGTRFHSIWEELGALPARRILFPEELVRAEEPDGRSLTVYTDLERLEDHMMQVAPGDAGAIREYINGARLFCDFDLLELQVAPRGELLRSVPKMARAFKWMRASMEKYAGRFGDPFVRRVFPFLMYDTPTNPVATQLNILAGAQAKRYGWPEGGSLEFARAIEGRFRDLGGVIEYGSTVKRVIVDRGRASGVMLEDGSERRADIVISNAYGYSTIYEMLGGAYTSRKIDAYYSRPVDDMGMGLHVSLGADMDLSAEAHAMVLMLEKPEVIADRSRDRLALEIFSFDASMAPGGRSSLKVVLPTSYHWWKELRADRERYREEKHRAADSIVRLLEPRFPGLSGRLEVTDVATPVTTERYTGISTAFKASAAQFFSGFLTGKWLSETLPGLSDFCMVGQWAGPPGVSSVAAMGRDLVRKICEKEDRPFVATGARGG